MYNAMSYWPKPPSFVFFFFFFLSVLNFFLNVGEFPKKKKEKNGVLQSAAGQDRELFLRIFFRDVAYPVNISVILLKHVQQQSELCRIPTTSCI